MLEEIKNIKSEKSDLRKFGVSIGIILLIISGILFLKEKESFQLFLSITITLFLSGIALPRLLKPVYLIWMVFATILGWFMTRVILTLLFYLILTPIGLVFRLFGKKFLELDWNYSETSYWNQKNVQPLNKSDYEKQF